MKYHPQEIFTENEKILKALVRETTLDIEVHRRTTSICIGIVIDRPPEMTVELSSI